MKRFCTILFFFLFAAVLLGATNAVWAAEEPTASRSEAVRVTLLPSPIALALGQSQTLVLLAADANGKKFDATFEAQFSTTGGQLDGNILRATTPGSFAIRGTYRNLEDTATFTAYQEKPSAVPAAQGTETAQSAKNSEGIVAGVTTEEPVNANRGSAPVNINTSQTNAAPAITPSALPVNSNASSARAIAPPWWADLLIVFAIVSVVLWWKRYRATASKP